jgi:hypothetical protein
MRIAPCTFGSVLLALALPAGAQTGSPWAVPAEGSCVPSGGLRSKPGAPAEDVRTLPFQTGDTLDLEKLPVLERYLPEFIWPNRERFFYEGMRLEIGPCFRDYGPPAFFVQATEAGRGKAKLGPDGGLESHGAGLPFHPEGIAPDSPQAGLAWLWNVQHRYQAAGFRGRFRMTDLVGRVGRAEPFEGEMFKLLTANRADRPGYEAPGAKGRSFVAGGLFTRPFDAREYAWRQFRPVEMEVDPDRSDDLHAYLPQWRRVRRVNASRTEGLYMPSFAVSMAPTQVIPGGGGAGGGIGSVVQAPADAGGTIQTKRSGYEGLEFRPLLYDVKVLGLHDVLAPLNSATPGYPENPDRDFGPWGLSFASDRWDLRRALVLDMRKKEGVGSEIEARQILYLDLQTLHPLYVATFDEKGEMTNVGMYVGRWSEDREGYPRWPDDPDRPVRVIDSVGAAFANLAERGSWRRESWGNVSTPPPDDEVKRLLSVAQLTKRR